jgi:colanic acid biosynthesis glycosyl transferase WcaI
VAPNVVGRALRLLVVSQYFWPENFRVNDLVAALRARGHEITVLSGIPNYPDGAIFPEYRRDRAKFQEYLGVPIIRVPLIPRGKSKLQLALNYLSFVLAAGPVGAWKLRRESFDAILVYQPSPVTACLPAILIGRLRRAPVLLWTLDLWPETLQAIGALQSPRMLSLVGTLVSFIYRNCALVLGQSRAFRANVERYAGAAHKFRYFPQWSEPMFYGSPARIEPRPELEPFASTFNVLFAGNIGEAQDFPAIIDAAEQLAYRSDIRWLIVGDGRKGEWAREEVARRGLSTRVHFLGRHPIEEMPAFFRSACALLVTLKQDPVFALTIPGKVQTYLAAGLPLLGMLDGEGARIIEESGAGLTCRAGDGPALAKAVERLASMSMSERAAMGRLGAEYSAREFDRDRLLQQLESWIAEASGPVVVRGRS